MAFFPDAAVLEYYPFANGLYDLSPAMARLQWSPADPRRRFFQIDREYQKFVENKEKGKKERLAKYLQEKNLDPLLKKSIAAWIIEALRSEYPVLAGEVFREGKTFSLEDLSFLVPDDLAIISTRKGTEERENWISFLSLFSPSHWAAEQKIGLDFRATHAPVAGIDRVLSRTDQLLDAMIFKGPFERFVWGFSNDDVLNHHPENALRSLEIPPRAEVLFVRVERQVLVGFPDFEAALFLIRTYHYDLRNSRRENLSFASPCVIGTSPQGAADRYTSPF